jgi:hypothetical protein
MHAARSDLKSNPKSFDMRLLNFLHARGSLNSGQSAQLVIFLAVQQLRMAHQLAFSLRWHPGHFSLRYALQAPQYSPQWATRFGSWLMGIIICLR